MVEHVSRFKCCGCEACVQACPKQCVSMVENEEGFLFPRADDQKCVKCGRCLKVCPALNMLEGLCPVAGYAYRSKDDELLKKTSSGGFFTAAAEKVLEDNGVVFGAAFNEQNEVVHCYVEDVGDLDKLRRSKYVQSRIGSSFVDCRHFLEHGRRVLFCGAPCQVKALNLFLGRKYDNLITIDFVCHGVPSPGVFKKYLKEISAKYDERVSDIKEINFREKIAGFAYAFSFSTMRGKYVENPNENIFLKGFLSDLYLRRSCHRCSAKNFSSGADYTMCDFWGIEKFMPSFLVGNISGVSQVFVINDKLKIFGSVNEEAVVASFDINNIWRYQKWLRRSVPMTTRRKKFFCKFIAGHSICEGVSMFGRQTLCERIRSKCLCALAVVARKVCAR